MRKCVKTFVHLSDRNDVIHPQGLSCFLFLPLPLLSWSWDKESRGSGQNQPWSLQTQFPSQVLPKLGLDPSFSRGGCRWVTHHSSSLCLPGPVLLEKTLIPGCLDNRRRWLTAGVGECREAAGSAHFRTECYWALGVGEPQLHLPHQKVPRGTTT